MPACSLHSWIWCRRWYEVKYGRLLCRCEGLKCALPSCDSTRYKMCVSSLRFVRVWAISDCLSAYRAENTICLYCKDQSWCTYVSVKSVCLLLLSGFNRTSVSSTDFSTNILNTKFYQNPPQGEPSCSVRTDGRTVKLIVACCVPVLCVS